ncbi:MAG: hypothetical protein WCF37_10330, partial [Pseudolabrys sp.]
TIPQSRQLKTPSMSRAYIVIPSLQGHFAASPAKAADVEFMNKKITEFLDSVTDNGKLLQ